MCAVSERTGLSDPPDARPRRRAARARQAGSRGEQRCDRGGGDSPERPRVGARCLQRSPITCARYNASGSPRCFVKGEDPSRRHPQRLMPDCRRHRYHRPPDHGRENSWGHCPERREPEEEATVVSVQHKKYEMSESNGTEAWGTSWFRLDFRVRQRAATHRCVTTQKGGERRCHPKATPDASRFAPFGRDRIGSAMMIRCQR